MTEGTDREEALRTWLATDEARSLLRRVARDVLRLARERGYGFDYLGLVGTILDDRAILEEIESQLPLFILENTGGIQNRLMLAGAKAGMVLRSDFLRHWLDATRTPKSDPWRYVYKRTVDVLRHSAGVRTQAFSSLGAQWTSYTLAPEDVDPAQTSEKEFEEAMSSIVVPRSALAALTVDSLRRADVLVGLAVHFWQELSERNGHKPIWVSVRTFINWVGMHVPLEKARRKEAVVDEADSLEAIPDNPLGPEGIPFDCEQIKGLARQFANSLTERERLAFNLHVSKGLTLQQVAERMGYAKPSGPVYQIDKVTKKLERFLCDRDWLSPPDLNREAFAVFEDELLSALKKDEQSP
ncbi:MAG: sigma-70 family RNA polymerase sigma factor [Thermodesulfobacteriota bacterium]